MTTAQSQAVNAVRSVRLAAGLAASLAAFACTMSGVARADCSGIDLFRPNGGDSQTDGNLLEQLADGTPFRRGRLWKLSREGIAPSYLFGTLHLSDRRLASVPETIRKRIARASVLIVETIELSSLGVTRPDPQTRAELQEVVRAAPDRRAEVLLSAEDFADLKRLSVERGIPDVGVKTWKAAVLALFLDTPACASGTDATSQPYLDARIVRIAKDQRVGILGLETLIEQFLALDGLSVETERALLVSVLEQARRGQDVVETQVSRYLKSDAGGILALIALGPDPESGGNRTPAEFLDKLLDRRSARMLDRLSPLLMNGNLFVAVGIGHLPGRGGLLALLQKAGYTVEMIE